MLKRCLWARKLPSTWEEGFLRMLRNQPNEMALRHLKGDKLEKKSETRRGTAIASGDNFKRRSNEERSTCLHLMPKSMVAFMVCEMQRATRLGVNLSQLARLHWVGHQDTWWSRFMSTRKIWPKLFLQNVSSRLGANLSQLARFHWYFMI